MNWSLVLFIFILYISIITLIDGIIFGVLLQEDDYEFVNSFPTPIKLRKKYKCSILGVIFLTLLIFILAPIPYFIRLLFRGDKE